MIRLFFAQSRSTRRVVAALLAAILIITLAGIGMTLAQGNTTGKIKVGDTVTGTLDSKNFAQSYSLDGKAGDKITITATRKTAGLTLALILAGPSGAVVSQAAELTNAAVTLKDVALPTDGQYLITVLRGTGAQGTAKGDYTLTVTGVVAPTPASGSTVALPQGMSVTLSWNTSDDLSLEVRDPVGGDVNWRNPTANGARLDNNTNADCATANANNPAETISWPAGNVTAGSYEIIVYFNKQCTPPVATAPAASVPVATAESPTLVPPATVAPIAPPSNATQAATVASTAQGDAAEFAKFNPQGRSSAAQSAGVSFALTITVNGDTQDPIRGTLQLNQQYVTSYLLNSPTSVAVQTGGPNLSIDLQPFANKIAAPTALGTKTSVTGTINHNNAADAWSFDLTANRSVTINMNANSGSLDAFLVLLGSDGNVLASNDDASNTTRDSQILNQTLPAGKYTIIATRFALAIGGTEGNYTLSISTKAGGTVTAIPLPNTTPVATAAPGSTVTSGALPTGSIEVLLTWDSRADLRLLIRDPAGQSVFSDNRNPTNSGILEREGNFKCPTTGQTSTPATYAYWPTNQILPGTYEVSVWMDSRCLDTNILPTYTLTITVNGKVVGNPIKDRPDPNKAHTLTTFTTDANGNATLGPVGIFTQNFNTDVPDIGSQLSNATPLTLGTPATGTIDSTTPMVLYTFQAKKNQRIIFDLKQSSGNLDPDMFLLDSTGKQLAENDDNVPDKDRNSHIDYKLFPSDGTYIIVATRYGARLGGTSGSFELDSVAK